jgi:hypothetical protein
LMGAVPTSTTVRPQGSKHARSLTGSFEIPSTL